MYRPCSKPVLITMANRGRFGILHPWLQSGDGWLCHVEYMNNGWLHRRLVPVRPRNPATGRGA